MKLNELSQELNISTDTIKKFIQDFDLELEDCISTDMEVKGDFEKFAKENSGFLKKYEDDLTTNKSIKEIAETIDKPIEKVTEEVKKEVPNLFENGMYKSSVSSFGIDNKLGGNYQFVYNYFGKKTPLTQKDFIGYQDLFFYLSDELEPFINPESAKNWGIKKPAGFILYGPPGSGKVFWAKKIAEIIGYQFREVKKYYYGTSFVNGKKTNFNDYVVTMMKEEKVVLFMEDFDEIMKRRNAETSIQSDSEETKEVVLHYISKFPEEDLLMVGSANSVSEIDPEILAPGRFDELVPIFPPNQRERREMICYYMLEDLSKDALLYKILEKNNADHLPFWNSVAERMRVFSNTMIVDFTQSLKKRIKTLYEKTSDENLEISQSILDSALRDSAVKLTDNYLNQVSQFLHDASVNNRDNFLTRIEALKMELETYRVHEKPQRMIGFPHNEEN